MLPARINLVTLGVADVGQSRAFYERLGLRASRLDNADVAFFDMNGTVLGLYGRAALAEDAGVADEAVHFHGSSLAINLGSKREVNEALEFAERCGARIVQPARDVFWGGYSGYFADLDGHLWEIAYNPLMVLNEKGQMTLPPPA